ncbi:MAG: helix-turn-helix domain-containing protein [Rhodoblastus sp.]
MERTSFADMPCSLARSLEAIGDWWSPLILRDLYLGVRRFDEIVEDIGISRNLLTRRLAALEKAGVVRRERYGERPARYEYRLAEAGLELVPILMALTAWGDRWKAPRKGAPLEFVHRDCGHTFRPRVVCSECAGEVSHDNVIPVPGPGARVARGAKVVARKLAAARSL